MNRSIAIPLVIVLILLVVFGAVWMSGRDNGEQAAITNFDECVAAGYPVMESFPEQCRTEDGRTFTREVDVPPQSQNDMVRVTSPSPNASIANPLVVVGEARGPWFFEASFPISLLDQSGTKIGEGYTMAQGEWMTESFVPFTGTISFTVPTAAQNGTLVLHKANASGDPERDEEVRIPVRISPRSGVVTEPNTGAACRPTGCSGQICADEDRVSTCEFRPEYSCYKQAFAKCERQANGQCGWTPNAELTACLANPPAGE